MLRIRLPYPDRKLNPNVRKVWQATLKPKQEAREIGYSAAWDARWWGGRGLVCPFNNTNPYRLRIAIHPPDNRRRDVDNIVASLKSAQDGIFDYIGLDDSKIERKEVVMRQSCPEGKVYYILYQV